jgi:hypothetical protein
MTMNTYTVISGDAHEVTAASEERALAVFHIWNGCEDGELTPGETCGHGDGETIVLPDDAPITDLLRALDSVSWILENWQEERERIVCINGGNDDLDALDALWAAVAAIRGTVN